VNENKLASVEATRKLNLPVLPLPTTLIALRMLEGGGDVNTAPHTAALSMPRPTKPTTHTMSVTHHRKSEYLEAGCCGPRFYCMAPSPMEKQMHQF